MRKQFLLIAALALMASACTDDSESTTTTTESQPEPGSPDTTEAVTTTEAGSDDFYYGCVADPDADRELCADYHVHSQDTELDLTELSAADFTDLVQDPNDGAHSSITHICLPVPKQFFVFPALPPEALPVLGLEPVVEFGFENDAQVVDYFDDVSLGLYQADDAVDEFVLIEDLNNGGFLASPHYYLTPMQGWKYGPATLVNPLDRAWADLPDHPKAGSEDGSEEAGTVIVIDTGGTASIELGVESAESEPTGLDDQIAGHGQFAASIVNRYDGRLKTRIFTASAEADVVNGKAFMSEATVIAALERANPQPDDVVNLSLGMYPCDGSLPPLGLILGLSVLPNEMEGGELTSVIDDLVDGVSVVAAAGNDGADEAMYPAILGFDTTTTPFGNWTYDFDSMVNVLEAKGAVGFDQSALDLEIQGFDFGIMERTALLHERVTAVGARSRYSQIDGEDNGNATWSNPGEEYVPGEQVVGWFSHDGGELGEWSGTSFAAPRYAACLAAGDCP